ncbi:MAG: YdgA family protein [Campylobacteraceae bacterium]|jgi:hypothetical protein|nr:YdgA family protein [Campylobacteraceae bacterium]
MKKLISVIAGIAVVGVVYFCFSAGYANFQVHKSFTGKDGHFDRFGVKYELIESQRGLLSSVYKTRLSVIVSPENVMNVTMESRAEFGVRNFDIFKIGKIHVDYEYSGNIKEVFGENIFNYLTNSTKNVVFDIGYDGLKGKITQEPQSLHINYEIYGKKEDFTYNFGALVQDIQVSFDVRNIVLKQHIDEITSVNDINSAYLKDVDYDIALNKNALDTWLGYMKTSAKQYALKAGGYMNAYFNNYTTSVSIEEQNDTLMSVNFKSAADELVFDSEEMNITLKDASFDISISQLGQESVNAVADELSKINLAMNENEQQMILVSATSDLITLLNTHPTVSFLFAGKIDDSKKNEVSGYIKYIGSNAYAISLFNLFDNFEFELRYSLDKEKFLSMIETYERNRGYLSDEEIEWQKEDFLSTFEEIGADLSGDMITGIINKNTNFQLF